MTRRRQDRRRGAKRPISKDLLRLRIESLGGQGDGIARHDGTDYYVAGALPGDEVLALPVARRGSGFAAQVQERLTGEIDPAPPNCPVYGTCGGCHAQHLPTAMYQTWKADLVVAALARRGFQAPPLQPMAGVGPGTRRRATFRGVRKGGRTRLGFNERMSHRGVALESCPLLTPALDRLLVAAEDLPVCPDRARATDLEGGIDLVLEMSDAPDLAEREHLVAFAEKADLARMSWRSTANEVPEPIIQRREPIARLNGVPVAFPAGGFLQPSIEGERLLTAAVLSGVGAAERFADLYGGLGTFSFPLTERGRVHLVESDAAAVAAAQRAAGQAGLGGRLDGECRDLDQRPLSAKELDRFDAVVFDPPRAGAAAQATELAATRALSRVVAVSCNPATFARDARTLCDGGFRLTRITPVDQFPWSAHLEVVGVFER